MKKIYAIAVALLGFGGFAAAQGTVTAKKVLDEVSAKLKTFNGITANFSYSTTDRKGIKRGEVNGKIAIKGQKYYIRQDQTEIFCDGVKIWNYNADSKEVTISDVSDEDSKTLTPQKLLSDFYDKDFTYKLASSKGNYYEIDMLPVDKRKNFKQVDIFVDKARKMITRAKITDKSDNLIQFSLSSLHTNVTLPDSKFVYDTKTHPGVDVISQ
jgi:outer membrane lipoprotein carrier protein